MSGVDFSEIQSEVVRGYQRGGAGVDPIPRRAVYLLVVLPKDNVDSSRAWLQQVAARVTTAAAWTPRWSLNVGLTWRGLKAVGHPYEQIFPEEFRLGMAKRADVLADVGDSAPSEWQFSDRGEQAIGAIVMIQGDDSDPAAIDAEVRFVEGLTPKPVKKLVSVRLDGNRENFGFVDGISQGTSTATGPPPRTAAGARSSSVSSCSASRTRTGRGPGSRSWPTAASSPCAS